MALTDNDKQWIKGAIVEGINGALETVVTPRFDALEKDVSGLKQDVSSLKDEVREVKGRLGEVEHRLCEVEGRLDSVENELEAITNDLKEIYDAIYAKPNRALMSAGFARMSSKEKLLVINEELLKMAKDAGVVLPR